MRLWTLLVTLAVLFCIDVAAREPAHEGGFGVGISLSSGYATVSAYLSNASYIDIAKVKGGEDYKAFMQGLPTSNAGWYCPYALPYQVCRFWPFKSFFDPNPLLPMLKATVAAAEAVLETSVKTAALSVYDTRMPNDWPSELNVQSALSDLSIQDRTACSHIARQLIPSIGLQGNCSNSPTSPSDLIVHEEQSQLILTVDYTETTMTASLWNESCGFLDKLGWSGSYIRGSGAREGCMTTTENKTACEGVLELDLSRLCRSRMISRGFCQGEGIDAVLITGERANDETIDHALRKFLQENFSNGNSISFSRGEEISPDPTFASSRAAAWLAWNADFGHNEDQRTTTKEL